MDKLVYKTILETMKEGLLIVDTMGTILAVNPAFEGMTGLSGSDLVGKNCRVLNCSGCKVFGILPGKPWCGLFVKGSVQNRRCQIVTRDGRMLHVVKHATVLNDETGQPKCAIEALTDISELVQKEAEIQALQSSLHQQTGNMGIVGTSRPIQDLLHFIENIALSDAPVLIRGESGVGKELVAQAIHENGKRNGSFIKVNCAALNENLLESELFGHVKGAYTGADRDRVGRFEAAAGGSIFLDEIGDISPAIQVKLLRVLESKEIERVGDHQPIPVDARIITATNKDLEALVEKRLFREDLFYRINVVPIRVPPLRERKEDIPLLAQTFIDRIGAQGRKSIAGLSSDALKCMLGYDWPGNVRELRNAVEYAFVLCHEPLIGPQHLTSCITATQDLDAASPEREELIHALLESGGSRSKAAKLLGVSRVTVWKRIKKYGLQTTQEPR